jgi:hypothetical protein
MNELVMAETSNPEETALFQLSTSVALSQFSRICLISSPQDKFSPSDSSLILVSPSLLGSSGSNKHHAAQVRMCQNIAIMLNCEILVRLNINYTFEASNVDTFIGRAAHIGSMNNPLVAEALASRFQWLINN